MSNYHDQEARMEVSVRRDYNNLIDTHKNISLLDPEIPIEDAFETDENFGNLSFAYFREDGELLSGRIIGASIKKGVQLYVTRNEETFRIVWVDFDGDLLSLSDKIDVLSELNQQVEYEYRNKTTQLIKKEDLIKKLDLSKEQVSKIVLEWYLSPACNYILQDKKGRDLEEILT